MAVIDEEAYLQLIRGQRRGFSASLARAGLRLASIPYSAAVRLRNLAFDCGWKKIHQAPIPVVSVGNLTLGGTGKTPMVEWVARRLREHDLRAAILSRGYGHDSGLNDEGRVLEENLPDVPHLQGKDRVQFSQIAVEELDSQILVLDDGMQHRRLARDLDIVLLDALDPFGLGWIFPRGLLREPLSSLKRAHFAVLTRADLVDESERARIRHAAERRAGPLNWASCRHAPVDLMDCQGNTFPLDNLTSQKVAAFCGIGNPEGFRRTLRSLGVTPAPFRPFPDHHLYTREDVSSLSSWPEGAGPDLVLTTQKDLVKLRTETLGGVPLRCLRIGLEFLEGEELLRHALGSLASRVS